MTNLLASGTEWLRGVINDHASESVSITRGAGDPITVTAAVGSTKTEVATDDARIVTSRQTDFLIDRALYDFGAGIVEPAEGDLIRLTGADGTVYVFKALPLGAEPCWRWSDPCQMTTYRIHAKWNASE